MKRNEVITMESLTQTEINSYYFSVVGASSILSMLF